MTKSDYINDTDLLKKLPVFYQPWYLDIFGINWEIAVFKSAEYTWIFPYFTEKIWGLKLCRPPVFTPYYGVYPLGNETLFNSELIIAALDKFAQGFADLMIIPIAGADFTQLSNKGFKSIEKVTYVLDLKKSEEELIAGLDSKARRNVRKSEETLQVVAGDIDPVLYTEWLMKTVSGRNGKFTAKEELVTRYISAVLANGAGIAASVYDESGQRLGMNLTLYDSNTAYNILLVNNPELKSNLASTALLWNAIREARKKGCSRFDFEGSKIKGVAEFFRRFGGERIAFNAWEKTNSLLWKLKRKFLG